MKRRERLRVWIESLDPSEIVDIAIECIDELIDAEIVVFYDGTKVPYWEGNGERLDGTEFEDGDYL